MILSDQLKGWKERLLGKTGLTSPTARLRYHMPGANEWCPVALPAHLPLIGVPSPANVQ